MLRSKICTKCYILYLAAVKYQFLQLFVCEIFRNRPYADNWRYKFFNKNLTKNFNKISINSMKISFNLFYDII